MTGSGLEYVCVHAEEQVRTRLWDTMAKCGQGDLKIHFILSHVPSDWYWNSLKTFRGKWHIYFNLVLRHGEGNGTPLQYSCLENPTDRGAWWAAVHGVTKSRTGLHFHFSLSCIIEGNGNPLQCSCLENSRDGRAWWAAIYGVAQTRTRLKRLSSSSSSSQTQQWEWRPENGINSSKLLSKIWGDKGYHSDPKCIF